jgi:class 3 adenylate cyclase
VVQEPVRGGLPDPSFHSLAGIEKARALLRGQIPRVPLSHLTGILPSQVGSGAATFTMPATPWLQAQDGGLDLEILAHVALDVAVLTTAPPASEVRTITFSLSFLRPCTTETGTVMAKARTLNTGPTFTLAEVVVEDGLGRNVAHGTGTFVISTLDPPPPAGAVPVPGPPPSYPTPDPYARSCTEPYPLGDDVHRLSWIQAMIAGEYRPQPLQQLLGLRFLEADEGRVSCSLVATEWFCGRSKQVSPGVLACLASHGAVGSVLTLMPVGYRLGLLDLSFNFFRPVPPDGHELLARGGVSRETDGIFLAESEVTDKDGNTVVVARQTSLFIPPRHRDRSGTAPERMLATVLFSDLVGSTRQAEQLGDARWQQLLDDHHTVVRKQIQLFKGREVKTTGDGFLATFDSPGRAVQCGRAIRDGIRRLGLEVRVGLHTGECEVSGTDVAGIAVHIASRIQGLADPGEVLVSGTVRDLVTGSGLRFADRGRHQLKGIEGGWRLFAVED